MISDVKRKYQKRRRDEADQRGDCLKCCKRPKQPGYQLCPGCRKQKEERRKDCRVNALAGLEESKGIDPRVNKAVRKLCYSLSATGCFDDGIPETGTYIEQPECWYRERADEAEDAISPFDE